MAARSMISGRSGKLGGGCGKDQPAISRTTTSALPTTIKYLAMGTTDSSRELSNPGQPMAAMLDHAHVLRRKSIGGAAPPHRAFTGKDDASSRKFSFTISRAICDLRPPPARRTLPLLHASPTPTRFRFFRVSGRSD
jgi:hypothetical protein